MSILQATRVTKRFGGLVAVNTVDLDVPEQSIYSIIGPNGAGKTTFFNCVSGFYRPEEGILRFNGTPLSELRPDQITSLGITRTYQNIRLFHNMTALENILAGRHPHMKSGIAETVFHWLPHAPPSREEQGRERYALASGLLFLVLLMVYLITRRADMAQPMFLIFSGLSAVSALASLVFWGWGVRLMVRWIQRGSNMRRTLTALGLFLALSITLPSFLYLVASRLCARDEGRTMTFPEEEEVALRRATDLLDFVGLAGQGDLLAMNLPYGAQRRLEIARALASEPRLLLLDEPTAGMNPAETEEMIMFIRRLRDELGITILLIEHDMKVVMGISDWVTVLDYGTKIAEGTPAEIQRNPRVIEAYLGKKGLADGAA